MIVRSSYIPKPYQIRGHASTATEKLFLGGVGAGKTLFGLHETLFGMEDNPECDGLIVSPTYPMLRDVVLSTVEQWLHPALYTWKKSDNALIYHPTGKKIFCRSATDPGKISGLTVGTAWFDEAALVRSDRVWKIIQARVRDPRSVARRKIVTTTPEGFNWVIHHFRMPGDRFVVKAKTSENDSLPDDFEAGLRAAYGEEYAAQYLDAEVLELSGLVWPLVPRIHADFTKEWAKERIVKYFGAVDWGFRDPACLLVGGVDSDGRWYVVEEWYKRGQDRVDVAMKAKELNAKYNVQMWFSDVDPEGQRHMKKSDPKTGLRGCRVRMASKEPVVDGIHFVRSLFPVRKDGEPSIYVHKTLKNFHREIESYQVPQDDGRRHSNPEIPIGAKGDHAMDTLRYLVYSHSKDVKPVDYSTVSRGRFGDRRHIMA